MPSAAELGMPAIEHIGWSVIVAPAGISSEILRRLNTELVRIVRSPDIIQIVVNRAATPRPWEGRRKKSPLSCVGSKRRSPRSSKRQRREPSSQAPSSMSTAANDLVVSH